MGYFPAVKGLADNLSRNAPRPASDPQLNALRERVGEPPAEGSDAGRFVGGKMSYAEYVARQDFIRGGGNVQGL